MRVVKLQDRYQNKPWPVKMFRWLRYTPLAFVKAVWTYITYPEQKLKKDDMSRLLMAQLVFSRGQEGMQRYYTIEEVRRGIEK